MKLTFLVKFPTSLYFFCEVFLVMTVKADRFEVVEVQSDLRMLNILSVQIYLVMYDLSRNDLSAFETSLT